jgi:hypothetical protein
MFSEDAGVCISRIVYLEDGGSRFTPQRRVNSYLPP